MDAEVVVVGAGPAGSTAAKYLAETGVDVLLIDKAKFPRDKVCADVLFHKAFLDFPYLEKNKREFIEREHYSVKHVIRGKEYLYKADYWMWRSLKRKKFDYLLYNLAKKAGARTLTEEIVDVKFNNNVELITRDKKKIQAEVVIGADGARSLIAKKTGLNPGWKPSQIVPCTVGTINLPKGDIDGIVDAGNGMYLKLTPLLGYGYSFAQKNCLNVGYGNLLINGGTCARFYKFIQFLKDKGIIPKNSKVENLRAWVASIDGPLKKTFSNRVLLCGDAGGFINPLSGEGVYYAMITGREAAKVIAEAVRKNNFSESFLSEYQKNWQNLIRDQIKYCFSIRKALYSPLATTYPLIHVLVKSLIPRVYAFFDIDWRLKLMANCMDMVSMGF